MGRGPCGIGAGTGTGTSGGGDLGSDARHFVLVVFSSTMLLLVYLFYRARMLAVLAEIRCAGLGIGRDTGDPAARRDRTSDGRVADGGARPQKPANYRCLARASRMHGFTWHLCPTFVGVGLLL